ncbi:MAG: serine hydrolase [Verrucomicrobiales bacterium]|nr:serine hydrolase [Verrucomicrobiales bacterium]
MPDHGESGMTRRASLGALGAALLWTGCRTLDREDRMDVETWLARDMPRTVPILGDSARYRLQILVSEVVPVAVGRSRLLRHGHRLGAEYFYPASSIKLAAAVAALQELETLQARYQTGDLLLAPMEIAALFDGDAPQRDDLREVERPETGRVPITVGRELRKLALVSDNQAFNRLFDLVGHEALNRRMHDLGLASVVINHRLSEPRAIPNGLASASVTLRPDAGPAVTIPARFSQLSLVNRSRDLRVGDAYVQGDAVVPEPMDFSRKNGISLIDLQDLLVKLARPDIDLGTPPLRLSEPHRQFLLQAMTQYPRESEDPRYPVESHPDADTKFLLPGVRRVLPSQEPGGRVEITNKIGRAYGFSVENAYLQNPRNGRAVFVSAVMYTNADGVLNDDKYEYESVADPFLADLGEWVTRRWLVEG